MCPRGFTSSCRIWPATNGSDTLGRLTRVLPRLVAVTLVAALAAATIPALLGDARAGVNRERLAKALQRRDPGKRVGGETLVATRPGKVLRGARGRINFMMALGQREVLTGGDRHDELGAYVTTRGARIHGGRARI